MFSRLRITAIWVSRVFGTDDLRGEIASKLAPTFGVAMGEDFRDAFTPSLLGGRFG